ncbi:MAG: phosphate ABC transporter substrate-binding protein [Deltaproteobacteria bacterium]|nr:phosphate ABC transporter substrate-binding protein [Deltaproteobacteria bacterium]
MTTTVNVKGSDTMVTLAQRWAEAFTAATPHTSVQVSGGGSGTGIVALINGTTDVCQASRRMNDKERLALRARTGSDPIELVVARDGLAIYVNTANPVDEISTTQLKDIYTGKLTNWRELGGPEATIIAYARENSSGTYVFFKEHLLDGADLAAGTQMIPGTAGVVNAVAHERGAIGFGGAAYAVGVKKLKVRRGAEGPAVSIDLSTIQSGQYPLARPLFFYLAKPATGKVKAFVDFASSKRGQAIVSGVGYFPVK